MSSSITTPIFKLTSTMAEISSLFLHSPSIFTSKTPYPILTIPSKPIKFQQLSFSLRTKKCPSIVSFVSQNPDSQLAVEEDGVWENEEFDDTGAPITAEESSGNDDNGGTFEEPSEDAKIYVGNLPYDLDHQGLAELFDQSGTVEIAEVIMNRDTNQSRGFGFVTMSTVEEAEKAVERLNGQIVNGRSLTVNKAGPRGSRSERPPRSTGPSIRIYVGNLPWDVDSSGLEQMFSEHGKVVEARVVSDRETGRSRGFGFVTMSSETETNDAIAALDGESLNGRAIRVNVAEERPRRNFF